MAKKTVSAPPAAESTESLVRAKLASSGLTWEDGRELGFTYLDPEQTAAKHPSFKAVPAIQLNYYHPLTGEELTAHPMWPAFYRLRYLKDPPKGFGEEKKKPPRYTQEPNSGVCAYFPMNIGWQAIFDDPERPLIITEGEFKAAKACKEGYPTIGLGGVYNYRSAKAGIPFLPELELIDWRQRAVYIIYDSDFRTNQNVCRAINELAEELRRHGALPFQTALPELAKGEKTGLDDFLLDHNVDELGSLLRDNSSSLTIAKPLWQYNDRYVFVQNPGLVFNRKNQQKQSLAQFRDASTESYTEQLLRDDGTMSLRPAMVGPAWLRWPLRKEVGAMTYAPGKPEFLEAIDVDDARLNLWSGWGVQPAKGDVTPFLELVDHIFTGATKEAKDWFLRWCAFPLQYPGVKMFSSVMIHGIKHGTGKSLLGYTLGRIYGKNFTEIHQKDLHGNFNEWAENKQFVLGDDITGSDNRTDNDVLKKMISQREIRLNIKFVPSYAIPDCINYMWTSNQPDAFFLEDDDRRFFIHEVVVQALPEEFYVEYDLWLDAGGSAAVFDYLLHLDLEGFNPAARAMDTNAKRRMTADVQSDLASWVRRLLAEPEHLLKIGSVPLLGDLFTTTQLLRLYDPGERTRTTANGIGRELRRAGARQVAEGQPVKTSEGSDRFYAIRNADQWVRASPAALKKHLDATTAKLKL